MQLATISFSLSSGPIALRHNLSTVLLQSSVLTIRIPQSNWIKTLTNIILKKCILKRDAIIFNYYSINS